MYNHVLYTLYWATLSLLMYFAGYFFPGNVVLGNHLNMPIEAAIYAGFWATFIIWTLQDFMVTRGLNLNNQVVSFVFYSLGNAFAIWIVARFADILGFGISSYHWALGIGVGMIAVERFFGYVLFVPVEEPKKIKAPKKEKRKK